MPFDMSVIYPWFFRLLLIAGSLCTVLFILKRIRHAKIQIEDSIFWFIFSGLLLLLSLFPQIAYWVAARLGFISPINVVYLAIIFLLLIKQFFMSVRLSQMDSKIKALTQKVALNEEKIERDRRDD
ncbi:DUF2304 domain-containing protein [Allofournierella sp.]|uniref:DUF2304 domain-containing protein n=1 Tax=Allofournierella sp. TaxID=1940256 RepID=UPI003AB86548